MPSLPPPDLAELPEDRYTSIAWLDDGTLLATARRETALGTAYELFRVDGEDVVPVDLEPLNSCRIESIRTLSTLPDGRLGFAADCDGLATSFTPSSVRVLDIATGASEELAWLPSGGLGGYTFAPGLSNGLMADSSRICSKIAAIEDGEVTPSDIVVDDGELIFGISDQFRDLPDSCTEFGNADLPAWSPDGRLIAFFASSAAIGPQRSRPTRCTMESIPRRAWR